MARDEHDRENLLRDATAFVARIELAPATSATISAEPIFIGFRAIGAVSIYFGADPVYHFNSHRELRRAYCGGLLFKAEDGQLISLQRCRQANEVQLLRHALSERESEALLAEVDRRLQELQQECDHDAIVVVGQVPKDANVFAQVKEWLSTCGPIQVASTANAH